MCVAVSTSPAGRHATKRLLTTACRALMGQKWRSLGDPCKGGPSARRTFLAQATFALPVPGLPGRFLLMADRWNQERLGLSRRAPRMGPAWLCQVVGFLGMLVTCCSELTTQ